MPSPPPLLDLITVHGPWLLFLLAVLETSFVTGLAVPSGVATSLATAVALEQGASLLPVALAAGGGGAIGDSIGFWIGRAGRVHWQEGSGRLADRGQRIRARASRWSEGAPFLSVTVARLISFVRTVMPMTAGMSGLSYRVYLSYDIAGVFLWCAFYMTGGAAAGRGWSWAADALGMGGALLLGGLVTGAIWLTRRRHAASTGRASTQGRG